LYYLDRTKLHTDILKRLNELKRPQQYLENKLIISRATIFRLSKDKEILFETFFKLIDWLGEEPEKYIKLKKQKK